MRATTTTAAAPTVDAPATLWRCGGRTCGAGECEHEEELHRHASGTGPSHAPPIVHDVLRSGGAPLPSGVRHDMEKALGHSFADVRIHTDSRASESARAVQAHAYTVGRHITFASGRYDPGSSSGRELLTHELTHAAQYAPYSSIPSGSLRVSSPDDPEERRAYDASTRGEHTHQGPAMPTPTRIWRAWQPPKPGECSVEKGRFLVKVVVDQEKPQSVTLHWNDGVVESGKVSTGKGHCCTDTDDGVVCSVTGSRRDGSNCTPITSGKGHLITDRYRVFNGWEFWSMFVPERGIGLHQHHTVTGNPLSHGCVRMEVGTAQKIFCGARQNQTRVEVRGFARPSCKDPQLQKEWEQEFRTAARQPTDGDSTKDKKIILENRKESRRILREAYGRELTDEELAHGPTDKLKIPRCSTTAAQPSVEERRAIPTSATGAATPTVSSQVLASSGFERLLPALSGAIATARGVNQAVATARTHGQSLWNAATGRTRGLSTGGDDRPLYWARLGMTRILRQWEPSFALSTSDRAKVIAAFEDASRGFNDISFGARAGEKRILISGFDPFGFDNPDYGELRASNPSAAAALALDGARLTNGKVKAVVQSVVFPVRFADFDSGMVERVIRPHLTGDKAVHMVMTISMGAKKSDYEVEEYAGRRRSGGTPDNAGATSTGVPPGLAPGAEFLTTSLPASARGHLGRTAPNEKEREIEEVAKGKTRSRRSLTGPSTGSQAVKGSGGGYLSNEIFYRVALLKTSTGSSVPVGHLHTPFLTPAASGLSSTAFTTLRQSIVDKIKGILEATLPDL